MDIPKPVRNMICAAPPPHMLCYVAVKYLANRESWLSSVFRTTNWYTCMTRLGNTRLDSENNSYRAERDAQIIIISMACLPGGAHDM